MENIWGGMGQKPFFSITHGRWKSGLSHFHLPKIGIKHPKNLSSTKKSKHRHLYPEEELWGKRCSIFVHHAFIMFNRFPATFPWVSNLSHHLSIIYSSFFHHLLIIFLSSVPSFSPSFSITFPSSIHHVPSFSPSFFRGFASFFHDFSIIMHYFFFIILHHFPIIFSSILHVSIIFRCFSIVFPWKNGAPGRLQDRGAAARSRERAAGAAFAAVAGAMAWPERGGVQKMGIFLIGIRWFFIGLRWFYMFFFLKMLFMVFLWFYMVLHGFIGIIMGW